MEVCLERVSLLRTYRWYPGLLTRGSPQWQECNLVILKKHPSIYSQIKQFIPKLRNQFFFSHAVTCGEDWFPCFCGTSEKQNPWKALLLFQSWHMQCRDFCWKIDGLGINTQLATSAFKCSSLNSPHLTGRLASRITHHASRFRCLVHAKGTLG